VRPPNIGKLTLQLSNFCNCNKIKLRYHVIFYFYHVYIRVNCTLHYSQTHSPQTTVLDSQFGNNYISFERTSLREVYIGMYKKDLGFTLTRNLCPNMHIQIICCKALKLLGFINRVASDFHLLTPLKDLFCSLVRPLLEYGTILGPVHDFCTEYD